MQRSEAAQSNIFVLEIRDRSVKRLLPILLFLSIPSWATITNVQHKFNSGSSITTSSGLSVTLTSTGAGNLLVASCGIRDNTTSGDSIAVSDSGSEVWQNPAASNGAMTNIYSEFSFYILNNSGGITSVTFKPSGGGGTPYTSMWCFVAEYSTTASGFAFDSANYTTGTTTSNTESSSITTIKSNDVIFSMADNSNGDSGTALAGFTNLDSATVNGTHQDQEQRNAAAGSYTAGQDSAGISNGQQFSVTVEAIGEATATPNPGSPDGLEIQGGKVSIQGGQVAIQ